MANLGVNVCGIKFKNPVVLASATPTKNADYMRRAFEAGAGGVVAKAVTDLKAFRLTNEEPSLQGKNDPLKRMRNRHRGIIFLAKGFKTWILLG